MATVTQGSFEDTNRRLARRFLIACPILLAIGLLLDIRTREVASHGIPTTALVVSRHSGSHASWTRIRYRTPAGDVYTDGSADDRVGATIPIRYLPDNLRVNVEMERVDAPFKVCGFLAGFCALVGTLYLALSRWWPRGS